MLLLLPNIDWDENTRNKYKLLNLFWYVWCMGIFLLTNDYFCEWSFFNIEKASSCRVNSGFSFHHPEVKHVGGKISFHLIFNINFVNSMNFWYPENLLFFQWPWSWPYDLGLDNNKLYHHIKNSLCQARASNVYVQQ